MNQNALLVVSFGTTHLDTLDQTIAAIEREAAAAMPARELYRAFTSGIVRRRLGEARKLQVDSPEEALEKLCQAGVTDLVIQPTHVMGGEEYDKLMRMAAPFADRIAMRVGKPLLTSLEDYEAMCQAVLEELPPRCEDTCHIYMGHGTEHYANPVYSQLEYMLHDLGRDDILIGTVEGYPALEQVRNRLRERPQVKRMVLRPLMVVAGDHAKNDLNGEEEDSWRSILTTEGYEVGADLRGLGEYPAVRALFVRHALAAQSGDITTW